MKLMKGLNAQKLALVYWNFIWWLAFGMERSYSNWFSSIAFKLRFLDTYD
jgi:hypothetical protein